MNGLNPDLLAAAVHFARGKYGSTKAAFVPSDAAAGGAPPGGDPSGGGAPPPPAGDPGAGGGAPPPGGDPSAGGAMPPPPPGGGGMDPTSIAGQVAQGVQQGLAGSGLQGQGGKMGPNGKPQVKPDINTIATDVFQLKKMLFAIMRHANIELPPDVLDGPNRDPMTGAPAESPAGGSDVQPGASMGAGAQSAIKPVQPMQGAFPSGGMGPAGSGSAGPGGMGGMGKTSSFNGRVGSEISQAVTGAQIMSKAAAVALMCRRRNESGRTDKTAAASPTNEIPNSAAIARANRLRSSLTPVNS